MTTPPVPDRLAEIVADAAARLEAAGEAVTPDAIAIDAMRHDEMPGVVITWGMRVAAADYLRSRAGDAMTAAPEDNA